MQTDWNENRIELVGEVASGPALSHQNHGEDYFRFCLSVARLSGCEDRLNVIVSRSVLESCPVRAGDRVNVKGEVRSFNNKSGQGSRLVITVYARELALTDQPHSNCLWLAGALCKPPIYRRTPLGREICDLMLAVNRRYGRADYLPCIAWGSLAQRCAGLHVGSGIRLEGRLQSRRYTKQLESGEEQRVAFEISAMEMELAE